MSSTLEYPGIVIFRAQMELPLPLDSGDLDFSEIQERLIACCDVVLLGLSLDDRILALKRWLDIYDKLFNIDESRKKLGFVYIDKILFKFKEAGFFDILGLADGNTVERVCRAIDELAALLIELNPDSTKIKPFLEELLGQLPLFPEYTVAQAMASDSADLGEVRSYELASRLYNESIDNEVVAAGCSIMNYSLTLQEWQLHNMKENDRAKFRALQALDEEMKKNFGGFFVMGPRSGAVAVVGSLLGSLSAEGRADSKARDEMIIEWQGKICSARGRFGIDAYIVPVQKSNHMK